MTSEKQIAANRENAKKSTGPRTAEGKARCSGNAIKHGLRARDRVVLNQESAEQFEAMRLCLLEEMQIGSAVEKLLLEDMAAAAWRLRRIARIEKEMMEEDLWGGGDVDGDGDGLTLGAKLSKRFAGDNAYSRLSRYEGRIRREMTRMFHELHVLRRQDRIENAEMWRRRRSVTGSGTEAERMVGGVTNRMFHNDDAIANCHGFVDGDEAYQDYHIGATDEYTQAETDYRRRMAAEQGAGEPAAPVAPVAPAAGRVGETEDRDGARDREETGDRVETEDRAESGCRGLPPGGPAGNYVDAPVGGEADRPVAEPVGAPVGAR